MTPSPAYAQIQSAALERGGLVSMSLEADDSDKVFIRALFADLSEETYSCGYLDDPGLSRAVPAGLWDQLDLILEDREWARRNGAEDLADADYVFHITRGL